MAELLSRVTELSRISAELLLSSAKLTDIVLELRNRLQKLLELSFDTPDFINRSQDNYEKTAITFQKLIPLKRKKTFTKKW
ncbi:hypothetical protein EKO25_07120 [Bacillus sp. SAJ1]|nr:hypothetical protein EKO25_07120 [Bacillus sp. SAJ1]